MPFGGVHAALAKMVRHAVLDLYGEPADVVRARTDEEQAAKRSQKLDCIRMIEDHFISQEAAFKGIHMPGKIGCPSAFSFEATRWVTNGPGNQAFLRPAERRDSSTFLSLAAAALFGSWPRAPRPSYADPIANPTIPAPSFHRCAICNLVVHPEQWKDIVQFLYRLPN